MIEEPPLLTLALSIERPEVSLVERFRGVSASLIVDAMDGSGALDWRIKPVVGISLIGVALTCDCPPRDNLALNAAIAQCEPGDVIVVATGGFLGAAVVGDLLLGIGRNRGLCGFVTDGLVRDVVDLEALKLPVYAMGVSPNSPAKRGPGSVGLPIVCGGCAISSGDVIVADLDGVVVVPNRRLEATLVHLERVKAAEAAMGKRVREGLKDVPFAAELLKGDRIRRVEP